MSGHFTAFAPPREENPLTVLYRASPSLYEREFVIFDTINELIDNYYYENRSSIDEIRDALQAYADFANSDLASAGIDSTTLVKLRSKRAEEFTHHTTGDLEALRLWERHQHTGRLTWILTEEMFDRGVEIWNAVYSEVPFYQHVASLPRATRARADREQPYTEEIIKELLQQLLEHPRAQRPRSNGRFTMSLRLR